MAQRGWKVENASHAIDVQVADGRVLALDKVAAVELQLPPRAYLPNQRIQYANMRSTRCYPRNDMVVIVGLCAIVWEA